MNSFDPVAAAVDWLDAYRAASPSMIDLYAADATLQCCCGGKANLVGQDAIGDYWRQQFVEKPATGLEDLRASGDAVSVSYAVPGEIVQADLTFNAAGKIVRSSCRPIAKAPVRAYLLVILNLDGEITRQYSLTCADDADAKAKAAKFVTTYPAALWQDARLIALFPGRLDG